MLAQTIMWITEQFGVLLRKVFWSEVGPSSIKSSDLQVQNSETIFSSVNQPLGLTIDTFRERIFFVDNSSNLYSVYSTNYNGEEMDKIVGNHTSEILFQIAYADGFLYWTVKNQQLFQQVEVDSASPTVTPLAVSLRTENEADSKLYSLVTVSTIHRPPTGTYSVNIVRLSTSCHFMCRDLFAKSLHEWRAVHR